MHKIASASPGVTVRVGGPPGPARGLDDPAGVGELAEPVVDPAAAHAGRGHQLGHGDAVVRGEGQRGPQDRLRARPGSSIWASRGCRRRVWAAELSAGSSGRVWARSSMARGGDLVQRRAGGRRAGRRCR